GWQFLQKRFKRKIDGLRGVEHGSKKLTHRTSPLIFKGLSAMLALMGSNPRGDSNRNKGLRENVGPFFCLRIVSGV
ncbi:hypothetical protein, partial [uncultured Thiocystis sp.]|uniref:hypothetical protein n=1 Tax=uncultured Thiocystis sp. TaxID=1202134 RepID=UPI0025D57497